MLGLETPTQANPIAPASNTPRSEALAPALRGKGRLGWLRAWGPSLLILAGAVAAWEIAVRVAGIPKWQLPAPSAIGRELFASWPLLWANLLVTLQEIAFGFGLALAVGLGLAVAIAYSRLLERTIYPLVISSQTIPIVAIAPLLLIWVGYGLPSKIIVVALICFYPIAVNTVDGLKSVDADLVNLMRTLGASRWQIFAKLQWPAAMPFMFSGVKIGISVSVIGAVIGEWVGASAGLGYLITYSQPLFLTARVFAAIVVLAGLGVALFALASVIERLLLPWLYNEKRARALERM